MYNLFMIITNILAVTFALITLAVLIMPNKENKIPDRID